MGIVYTGIPHPLALDLARRNQCGVFIESGTFQGSTARWAADHFPFVFTMERSQSLFAQHSPGLKALGKVEPLCGNSATLLPHIVGGLGDVRAMYWLDAHLSGDGTAGADLECPLLDELAALTARRDDIILIDDARLFLCAPPRPHKAEAWPTLPEIVRVACPDSSRYMQIVDDVIAIVPSRPELVAALTDYAQQRATTFWQNFSQFQRLPAAA